MPSDKKGKDQFEYLRGVVCIHDREFVEFAHKNGKTEEQLIHDIAITGFSCGMDLNGEREYWEPKTLTT